jgi:hypothetical protein
MIHFLKNHLIFSIIVPSMPMLTSCIKNLDVYSSIRVRDHILDTNEQSTNTIHNDMLQYAMFLQPAHMQECI